MRVKAKKSFIGYDSGGIKCRFAAGDEFELPAGVDWLDNGLVEAAPAAAEPEATPVKPAKRSRKKKMVNDGG